MPDEVVLTWNGTIFLEKAEIARSFAERTRGLLGRAGLPDEHGLLIVPCSSIHTLFMKFSIDAIFLDRAGLVVRVVRNIQPGRLIVSGGPRAHAVLEIASGWLPEGSVKVGDQFAWPD